MSFLVLGFPELNPADFEHIQNHRKEHDKLFYPVVAPHVTFVFAVQNQKEAEFIQEAEQQLTGVAPIHFILEKAVVHKDVLSNTFFQYMVPGKGYAAMVQLHRTLYSGTLQPYLRKDIEYIPHITIGRSEDAEQSKQALNNLWLHNLCMEGLIKELTVVHYENNRVTPLKYISLTV